MLFFHNGIRVSLIKVKYLLFLYLNISGTYQHFVMSTTKNRSFQFFIFSRSYSKVFKFEGAFFSIVTGVYYVTLNLK